MFKRIAIILALPMVLLLVTTAVLADDLGFPWQDHAAPFDFTFGNLIDNHQQTKRVGRDMLQGFIYIQFTGEEVNGVPEAVRADCGNPDLDCRVGWKVKGIPVEAKLVSREPRLWEVDESLMPSSPNYVHFHWVGTPKKPCGLVIGQTYPGYLLQRTAVREFFWLGGNPSKGNGGHLVTPGMDLHSNLVTLWEGGGGGHEGGEGDEGGCSGHDGGSGGMGGDEGGTGGHDGGSGGMGGSGDSGGCGDHEEGDDGGCSGDDGGSGGMGGPGGSGGCGDHEEGEEGGCSGH